MNIEIQKKLEELSEYANEYISKKQIERVNAISPNPDLELGEMVYEKIMSQDNSADFNAGYIFALKEINEEK